MQFIIEFSDFCDRFGNVRKLIYDCIIIIKSNGQNKRYLSLPLTLALNTCRTLLRYALQVTLVGFFILTISIEIACRVSEMLRQQVLL